MRVYFAFWILMFVTTSFSEVALANNYLAKPLQTASNSAAQRPKAQVIALDYINTLTSRDYQHLADFYSRDTHFYDKTAGKKYTGGRHIIDFFKRAHSGVKKYDFNLEHMYHSGSLVVMIGNYHVTASGEQFGKPGKTIDIAVPGVTTLKLDLATNRVKQHTDFIDYQTMEDQLATQ